MKQLSKEQYNQLFHEATLQANAELDGKTFQDLQAEDLKAVEQQDKQEREKETRKQESQRDLLNKQGSQMSGENQESMAEISMDQAMSYTSQATD